MHSAAVARSSGNQHAAISPKYKQGSDGETGLLASLHVCASTSISSL